MVSFDETKRSNLNQIKNNELRNFINSRDKLFSGGADASSAFGRNSNNRQQIGMTNSNFIKLPKGKSLLNI